MPRLFHSQYLILSYLKLLANKKSGSNWSIVQILNFFIDNPAILVVRQELYGFYSRLSWHATTDNGSQYLSVRSSAGPA